MLIESRQNKQIKELFALKTNKGRKKAKSYYVEGLKVVKEAIDQTDKLIKVFYKTDFGNKEEEAELLRILYQLNIENIEISDALFKEIADTEQTQGIIGIVRQEFKSLEEILVNSSDKSTILILDRVQDPGNLGTIIRTAEAFGVSGIILCKGCVDAYNPKVVRSTMGSILRTSLISSEHISDELELLKKDNYNILVTSLDAKKSLNEMNFSDKNVLVIGNEANGVSIEIQSMADRLIKIPMIGQAESLNAAVATSIILYEIQSKVFL